ncbi:MAG: AAA family ATPase [Promethearchaeia archaeon]
MKITKLSFKNFMGYKNLNLPKNDQKFPDGLILISGENSHGKSTILEAILVAFFGPRIIPGRTASSFITYGSDKAELYVYFTLDDQDYYMYRKWGQSGGTTKKLFKHSKHSKSYQEIKDFDIEEFFEISKDQALSTVFVRQGEVEELANLKGAKLRDMIIDLFRLNIIDDALNHLKIQSRRKKDEKSQKERSLVPIERIKKDIDQTKDDLVDNESKVRKKENKLNKLKTELKELPSEKIISQLESLYEDKYVFTKQTKSTKQKLEQKINTFEFELDDIKSSKKINKKLAELEKQRKEIESKKDKKEKKKAAMLRGKGKTSGRINDIQKKISKMKNSISFKKGGKEVSTAKCPTCQGKLTKEHFDEMISRFESKVENNQNKIKTINSQIRAKEKKIKEYRQEIETINNKYNLLQNLQENFNDYQKFKKKLKAVKAKLENTLKKYKEVIKEQSLQGIKKISHKIVKLKENIQAVQKEIKNTKESIQDNKERIKELNKEIEQMKKLKKKIEELDVDIEHIAKAKEFVRRFVTEYMVVQRLVKNIARKTNNYISNFTGGQYDDLLLDLTGSRKTGLSIKIRDNFNGMYEAIEVLSGGDRTALGMALRLAISELMSIIRPTKDSPKKNPKVDFLLLDEPLAALDAGRRKQILKYLTKNKTFSQIFLITHTAIPPEIHAHRVLVNKDKSTGLSHAVFKNVSALEST